MKRISLTFLSTALGITLLFLLSTILNQTISGLVLAETSNTDYEIVDLGTLGGPDSQASDLNNTSQVVGKSTLAAAGDEYAGFIWVDGNIQPLTTSLNLNSKALAINEQGKIAGTVISAGLENSQQWPVLWANETYTILETISQTDGIAADINDLGIIAGNSISETENYLHLWQDDILSATIPFSNGLGTVYALNEAIEVVGHLQTGAAEKEAFHWHFAGFTPLGTLGGANSNARDINNAGQIVGSSTITGEIYIHAFIWEEGIMTDLGTTGDAPTETSEAKGINDLGIIVGQAQVGEEQHAVMWVEQELIDLNDLLPDDSEWELLISAESISNEGQIVGTGLIDGQEHGFLLSPKEPWSIVHLPIIRSPADPATPTPTSTPTPTTTPSPNPTSTRIPSGAMDMLPFMRGNGQLYEVQHSNGPQTRHQTQRDDPQFFYVKGENLGEWEELWADEAFIYRGTDTSPGAGASGEVEYYTLYNDYAQFLKKNPGDPWIPRYWRVGDIYKRDPYVVFFKKSDCAVVVNGIHRTSIKFEQYHPQYTFSTGITLKDVVQLAWLDVNGNFLGERWFFAKEFGLVGWEGAGRFSMAISEIHPPNQRPDMVREVIPCIGQSNQLLLPEQGLSLEPLPKAYAPKVK